MGYWLTLRARSQCRRGYHEDGGAKAEHKQSLQEADCIVTLPIPYRTGRKMLSGPEIVSVTIFQPALPYRTRRCALRMAFWKANSTVPLRVCWRMAWSWFGLALKKTRRRSRHICIRGMPVAASRRGRSPQEAVLLLSCSCVIADRALGGVIHRQAYPKAHRCASDSKILLRFKIQGCANPQETKRNGLEK